MKFEETRTYVNLARAFAGECQAGARYQFIAQKAMQEGYEHLQVLIKTIAKEEMAHAKIFWDLISKHTGGKNTNIAIEAGYPFLDGELVQMLRFAADNENSEYTSVYPSFAQVAQDEGFEDIAIKFRQIVGVENCHFMLFDQLYNLFNSKTAYKSQEPFKWKCNHCGYEDTSKDAWKTCPLCGMGQGYVQIPVQK